MGSKFEPSRKQLKPTTTSSGIGGIAQLLAPMIQNNQRADIGNQIENIKKGLGREFNPGETVTIGGASITPNPKLDNEQTKAVAASKIYPDVKNKVEELIRGGVLNSEKGFMGAGKGVLPNADRTVRQFSAEQSNPLATYYDSDLQNLQSKLQKLRELMFERGGTALTPTEEKVLGSAFVLHGKTDEQILEDIRLADALVEEKARIALGGANAAKVPVGGMEENPPEVEDRNAKLNAIKERFKKRNP